MAAISTSSLQTSGSSDMPYMICDVLVVFLERHVLSYDLSHFSHSRCYLAKYKKHTFLVFLVQQRELTCPQFFTHANFPLTVYFYSSFFSLIRDHRSWFTLLPYSEPTVIDDIDIIDRLVEQLKRGISSWWNAMERIIVSREISTKIFKSLKLTKLTRFYSSWRSSNIREQLHLYVFIYIYGYIPFEKKIYVYMCV